MISKPKHRKRHKQTIACDISPKARKAVYERDSADGRPVCIICGGSESLELAHYIPRSQGGIGIPENLVTLCKYHHQQYDQYGIERDGIRFVIEAHLKSYYPGWAVSDLIYDKFNK